MNEQIFPENRFDDTQQEDLAVITEIPEPPGNGGGPVTPGAEPVMIDTYLPWLLAIALLMIFLFRNKIMNKKK